MNERSLTTQAEEAADRKSRSRADFRSDKDWEFVLGREQGRRVLAEILGWAPIFEDISPGSAESHAQLGARRVGLRLFRKIESAGGLGTAVQIVDELSRAERVDRAINGPNPAINDEGGRRDES